MACWGGAGADENRARRAMMALTRYYIAEGITITNCNYSPTLLQAKPQILVSRIGITFGVVYLLARLIILDQQFNVGSKWWCCASTAMTTSLRLVARRELDDSPAVTRTSAERTSSDRCCPEGFGDGDWAVPRIISPTCSLPCFSRYH
jgi:hypothetical protein